MNDKAISAYLSAIGRKGGQSKSAAKRAATQRNIRKALEARLHKVDAVRAQYKKALANPDNKPSADSLSANIRGLDTLRKSIKTKQR